jgi:outer membrane protein assembly factor BamD
MKRIVCLLSFCLLTACVKQVLAPLDAADEYERALSFFNAGKYVDALTSFERIIFYYASSEYVDDAQYWLARSYFAKKDYSQAILEFDYLIKNFTNSSFLEEAYLFRAKSYYSNAPGYEKDQTETRDAIGYLDEFLTQFPTSTHADEAKELILTARSRLAIKELASGKTYMKMNELDAAIIYFKYILESYPETKVISETKYSLAGTYEKKKMFAEALVLYRDLLNDAAWKHRAEKKIRKLEKK